MVFMEVMAVSVAATSIWQLFDPITERWFFKDLGEPTKVQEVAWPAIASGSHTLVSAPTGTGKTLSAFLVFVDRMKAQSRAGTLPKGLQLIYISPLKSLAGDIRENLRKPLNGIYALESEMNCAAHDAPFDIQVGLRTGDTTAIDRRKMFKNPPHILITTPESLFILLSSVSGRKMLKTAKAMIIDEIHALLGTKRGAHLMLSLARLDKLCGEHLQCIGLSATLASTEEAASYLSPDPVIIAAPNMTKDISIKVVSPLSEAQSLASGSIWPDLARLVYQNCEGMRSVLAFVEGRLHAEKLAYYVNQIAGQGFARTHHGSVSKEQRFEVEDDLRSGRLRLLCATSSMELGIDVGDIDKVLQIGCPRSISSTMQRLGRAGHNPGRLSEMSIFPRTGVESLFCGLTAAVSSSGSIEKIKSPRLCLDVLAQHLVSMSIEESFEETDVLELTRRAWPFKDITLEDVRSVLTMLAGDHEHLNDIPVRPRLLYDRINGIISGDNYSRMLALSAGGTIPDRGMFAVKNEAGTKLGELDEEFVFESRVGDRFLLGTFSWRIVAIERDNVIVTNSNAEGGRPPFWKEDWSGGRTYGTAQAFGALMRNLVEAQEEGNLLDILLNLGMDEGATEEAIKYIERQLKATGALPTDHVMIAEHFQDDVGDNQLMIHSLFGKRINAPLALLLQEEARKKNVDVSSYDQDDGILLIPYTNKTFPEKLLLAIDPDSAEATLRALLPRTPLFNFAFRYNANRALLMGIRKAGRQPLWIQRLKSAELLDMVINNPQHPIVRETTRECLEDYWDLEGLKTVLRDLHNGSIKVREIHIEKPSPMSLPLRRQAEAVLLYEYSPTSQNVYQATMEALQASEDELLKPSDLQLSKVSSRSSLPQDIGQLHSMLMIEGDFFAGEYAIPLEWLEELSLKGRADYIEPGLWIAAEHLQDYQQAFGDEDHEQKSNVLAHIIRRLLRYRGAQSLENIADRYVLNLQRVQTVLDELIKSGDIVQNDLLYYHAELFSRARHLTIKERRNRVTTSPPQSYIALMTEKLKHVGPPQEQVRIALGQICDLPLSLVSIEQQILPTRVTHYRPALLDQVLSEGEFFWHMTADKQIVFRRYEDIDWQYDITDETIRREFDMNLSERKLYTVLLQRGASFSQGLMGALDGESPVDSLLALVSKNVIHSDSFMPLRQIIKNESAKKEMTKQQARQRASMMSSGRWELNRPIIKQNLEARVERALNRVIVLCRETVQLVPDLVWNDALKVLRMWEYTGRVRRGYFVDGMSGAQYILEQNFTSTLQALQFPSQSILWISANDPMQLWGRVISHQEGSSFMLLAGTIVALKGGKPVAVLERQGQTLRFLNEDHTDAKEVLVELAMAFKERHILAHLNRLVIKQYPVEFHEILLLAGFKKEMQDFTLYR